MTMWRPNEPAEEDVSDLPGIDPRSKRRRSRRRAWRDGLADQTVVQDLEDVRSYRAFERALIGSVDPRSVVELALVHRLASLMWRLRRASAIETGLFQIQSKLQREHWEGLLSSASQPVGQAPMQVSGREQTAPDADGGSDPRGADNKVRSPFECQSLGDTSSSCTMARCFLRLFHLHSALLERSGAYEARLWRQAAQTILILDAMKRPLAPTRARPRKPALRSFWDAIKIN